MQMPQAASPILVAIDREATSELVLCHADAWSRVHGGELTVFHVVEGMGEPVESASRAAAEGLDQLVTRVLSGNRERVHSRVAAGSPAARITAQAESIGAGLIVMGSHGRGVVGRVVLGSVAHEVLRQTTVPVLIVRAPPREPAGKAVVVGVDFSDATPVALDVASRLAARRGATLTWLHVLPIGDHASPGHQVMKQDAYRRLEALRAQSMPSSLEVRLEVEMRMEAVGTAIAEHAETQHADLVVMGGHGERGWVQGVLGSVTERVLHETRIPVLVIRAGESRTGRSRD